MKQKKVIIPTVISGLLSTLAAILGSIATSTPLPPPVVPYLRFAWPAFGIVTILGISLTVRQTLSEKHAGRSEGLKSPRQRMLGRVRIMWIDDFLEPSLHDAAHLDLGLQEQQDAVVPSRRSISQEPDQPAHQSPAGAGITGFYDKADGELLILGEPGSGKTTLLLELMCDLLGRADHDEDHPIPVVFNLSSWAGKRPLLTEWLIEELSIWYSVPKSIGQSWVENYQILPLLDGLDEVAEKARADCVDAINDYRKEHGLFPTVVCSRSAEYHDLVETKHKLRLQSAIVVQPLTKQQIDDYLRNAESAPGQLKALRQALQNDPVLDELAHQPFMLSIFTRAYQGAERKNLPTEGTREVQQRQVFATYVDRMFKHREESPLSHEEDAEVFRKAAQRRYESALRRLKFLAARMQQSNQTVFYVEDLRSDWLGNRRLRFLYRVSNALILGLAAGLVVGLFVGLVAGLVVGLFYGVSGAGCSGDSGTHDELLQLTEEKPAFTRNEKLPWGFFLMALVFELTRWLIIGLVVELIPGFITGLVCGLISGLVIGLISGLVTWLIGGLVIGLFIGLVFWATVKNGMIFGLRLDDLHDLRWKYLGPWLWLVVGLVVGLVSWLIVGPTVGLIGGLVFGLGGVSGFFNHYLLRFWLWCTGRLPWNLVAFLDEATDWLLLRKVGKGYIFIHRLLLDYLASLEKTVS